MIPGGPMQYSKGGLALTESFEGLYLAAYPDPASPLARKLQAMGKWEWLLSQARKGIPYMPAPDDPPGDPWTCGYGTTGPKIQAGLVWTKAQADDAMNAHMAHTVNCVNSFVDVEVSQGEFDALVDFAFNAGTGALLHSTLLRLLNSGDYAGAAAEFEKWDRGGGKVMAGLLRRRMSEESEFKQPPDSHA